MLFIFLCSLSGILLAIYFISRRNFDYWKKRNVPYLEPHSITGNYGDFVFLRKHVSYVADEICKRFPNEPYIGAFYGTEPALIVKDPELIKLVTTKDFYYFSGRENSDHVHKELFTQNLFNNNGDQWKVVRQNLTPVFTSAKLRNMFHLIAKCSYELENLVDAEYNCADKIDVRRLITRFTMACITSCGFGVDSDTMTEGYNESTFTKIGDNFFKSSRLAMGKRVFKTMWPGIFYALGLKVVPDGVTEFFEKFLISVFQARKYKPTSRNDLVDYILNFKQQDYMIGDSITNIKTGGDKKVKLPLTDELLKSQCLVFFLAGFETSATTTNFTAYMLAQHPEIQKKVQKEIDAYLVKYENRLTYDIVNELPYTYACVEEALRLFPVLGLITREVVEDYKLPTGVHLEKGTRIHLPVLNLHRDPKYFPEPEVFRPERFHGNERQKIVPYSYMPFGEGSRLCIGKRFAKMQILAGLVTLMKKYTVEMDEGTPRQLTLDPCIMVAKSVQPMKMNLSLREGWESRVFVRGQ